jgi:hypothetical protein
MIWENDMFEGDVLSPTESASPATSTRSSVNGSQYSSYSANGLSGSGGNVMLNAHSRQSSLAGAVDTSQQWSVLQAVDEADGTPVKVITVRAQHSRDTPTFVQQAAIPSSSGIGRRDEAYAREQSEARKAALQKWSLPVFTAQNFGTEARALLKAGMRSSVVQLSAPTEGLARCFIRRDMGMFGLARSYELRTEEGSMFLLSACEWQCDKGSSLRISQAIEAKQDKGAAQLNVSHNGMEYSLWGQSKPPANSVVLSNSANMHLGTSALGRTTLSRNACSPASPTGPALRIQVARNARPASMTVTCRLPVESGMEELTESGGWTRQRMGVDRIEDVVVMVKRGAPTTNNMKVFPFDGRNPVKSNKNFQLVYWNEASNPDAKVLLQLCKISDSTYALDFAYPFTAETAFAVALAAMVNRIGN